MGTRLTPYFHGELKAGKLSLNARDLFDKYLKSLKDGAVVVEVYPRKNFRTIDQNAFLWGWVYPPIVDHTGETAESLHEVFKQMFLPKKTITIRGNQYLVPVSSTELSKQEFSEFIERILTEAAEMNIVIPNPETL